jgi:Protein of unknown function (DUF3048) N-terminal domain/Protein of unknown function (DUF3048) C-terminal domain
MVDDIRPSMSKKRRWEEKKQNNEPQKLIEPPQEVVYEASPEQNLDQQENGFVVLPERASMPATRIKNPFKKFASWVGSLSKKQKIVFVAVLIIALGSAGAGTYALFFQNDPPPPPPAPAIVQKVEEPPKPTTEASKLTGVQISPELNKRPITSIQIENSPDARPQSALHQAGVVFEAIAEGGITRFNASFQEAQPDYIGPIRSVRPYYAALVAPFDPIFVHAGGSGDGLAKLSQLGLKDMDHGANGAAFKRVSDRFAPHNLYSSTADLDAASAKRGYTSSDAKSFLRKAEKPNPTPTANKIDLNISAPLYNVHYDYDPTTNSYKRSMAGQPHNDFKSGAQITPKVVVALVMGFSQNGIYSVYQTTGSGTAFVFQDGEVAQVTWTKASDKEQLQFTDSAGKPLGLNPGQTWFTLVKAANAVTFVP